MPLKITDVSAFAEEWAAKYGRKRARIAVAVDGSLVAEKAYEAMASDESLILWEPSSSTSGEHVVCLGCASSAMRRSVEEDTRTLRRMCQKGDDVHVLHIMPGKGKLDYRDDPLHLARQYDMHQMHLMPLIKHTFNSREKPDPSMSTGDALVALADELQVDVLFVGAYGRKGQKSILGSTASGALRNSACSVCLVRRPPQKPISTPTTWCVAVDGGRASLMAFASVMHRHAKPKDKIIVMMADFEDASRAALEPFKQALAKDGRYEYETHFVMMPDCEFKLEHVDSVPEAIITRAEHMQADYLVMGIAGISKLGSVTEDIISHAISMPVLMHKDDQEVTNKRSRGLLGSVSTKNV